MSIVSSGSPSILTPALAQEIAGDTSAIIGLNILITDTDGLVIGSGDLSRVGTFHEASVEVICTLQPAAHNAAQARQLRGVRPGVTLPIMLDDQAVGTVGITGPPNRVRRFGLVVKRQTEILLQESVLQHSRLLRERALEDLIRDLAHFDAEVLEPDVVAFRAHELGYDLGLRRLAALVEVSEAVGSDDDLPSPMSAAVTIPQPALLRVVRERFADPQDMVAAIGAGRILTFHRIPPSGSRTMVGTALRSVCERIVSDIAQRHGVQARVGIGDAANSVSELRESYEDAAAALRLGSRLDPTTRIYPIDAWRLPRVLAEVGHRTRARLIDVLAKPLRDQRDWPVLQLTVLAWCESGFNLVAAAAALHVHRNTLIYRLDKVARLTGRDTHDHRATLALYLACLADRLEP